MGYSVLNVAELEGEGPGDAVKFVRRRLGVEAFGINWFDVPPDFAGPEHDETASGQEEVNVIVGGSGSGPGPSSVSTRRRRVRRWRGRRGSP